ncbi:hypothetical protein [Streptomyces odontomachi]|uniref:hypothetical protein n=1 Tax=Streptomyces odontomachi TaxID=2944940 RepID=UPI00210DDD76|nr:hypothetical protein [Streptomyces sp. ODS25]
MIPSATKAKAGDALTAFVAAYNKSDKAYDPALDEDQVTGALADINQSGLKAKHVNNPQGNPDHTPLKLTDPKYTIPKMAGWPKFFVVEADSNRDQDGVTGQDNSWLMVFTRSGPHAGWRVSYLTIVPLGDMPEFEVGKDGLATAVAADDEELAITPNRLSPAYVTYLDKGGPAFAPGAQTSAWRQQRNKDATRAGLSTQFIDKPLSGGAYEPVGLRIKGGGALVFFATRHYEKQTAAPGVTLNIPPDVKALTTGEVKQSITLERVSNQTVIDPPKGGQDTQVRFISRIQGLTGAKGE